MYFFNIAFYLYYYLIICNMIGTMTLKSIMCHAQSVAVAPTSSIDSFELPFRKGPPLAEPFISHLNPFSEIFKPPKSSRLCIVPACFLPPHLLFIQHFIEFF